MFNVKVFKITDIIKYLIVFVVIITSIILIINKINNKQNLDSNLLQNNNDISKNKDESIANNTKGSDNKSIFKFDLISCLNSASSLIYNINNPEEEKQAYNKDIYEEIIKSQIGAIDNFEKTNIETDMENENNSSVDDGQSNNTVQTGLPTEVITNNPIALNYNTEYGNVKIKNETSFELNNEIMNPNISIENKNILLFHTHTCESYTSSEKYNYEPTGNFRTTDLNYSVVRVGDELTNYLVNYGYNVIHNKTYHDYPAYNGSYTRSLETVQNTLNDNPSDIIFDIHRDAIGSRSDYAPCVKIGEDECSQIMFVIGSDEGGLWHPNWNQNLKFAIKVQEKAEEMYPGLFKPITLTKYRYNQHTGKYASIIEVGATGNTLEQCLNSMKYFSKVLDEVIK